MVLVVKPIMSLRATYFNSAANVGNAKFDNLRIWSSARTATEIANNYVTCLTKNETDLVSSFNGYNGRFVKNLANNSFDNKNFPINSNYYYVHGCGCSVAPLYAPIDVGGLYTGIFCYV